jgi:hypothetical protein
MSVLDSVLRFHEQKKAEEAEQMNAPLRAMNNLLAVSQQAQQMQNQNLITQLTAAKQGFRIDNGQLVKDPNLGGGLDQLKQQDLISKINSRTATQNLLQGALNGQGGNLPPGSRVTSGGVSIPLNQKLTESEQGTIAGVKALDPVVKNIEGIVDSGVLESKYGDVGRTVEQALVDSNIPLLVSKSKGLSELQSALAELRKTLPFTEGGKQLTETEKTEVFSLIKITGKDNNRIKSDVNKAMNILREKEKLALGGGNVAQSQQQNASNKSTQVTEFNSLEEAESANLPSGTEIMIGGRKARVE